MNKVGEPGAPDERFVDVFNLGALLTRAQTHALMGEMGVGINEGMLRPVRAADVYVRTCANLVNQQYRQGAAPAPPPRSRSASCILCQWSAAVTSIRQGAASTLLLRSRPASRSLCWWGAARVVRLCRCMPRCPAHLAPLLCCTILARYALTAGAIPQAGTRRNALPERRPSAQLVDCTLWLPMPRSEEATGHDLCCADA